MDGKFVGNVTFGAEFIKKIRPLSKKIFDVHLMIEEPQLVVDDYLRAGADIIMFHYEAMVRPFDIFDLIKKIRAFGVLAGMVIKLGTDVEKIKEFLPQLDYVLVMSVEPGFGGQKFQELACRKCMELVEIRTRDNLKFEIEIDGGINNETKQIAIDAGCDILVAGSYIFGFDNLNDGIRNLR
jgi:ribulose-phosphate 3-epimerase